jgi:catalase
LRPVATNQTGGQMALTAETPPGHNPHVNYEPSSLGGLREAPPDGADHTPYIAGNLVKKKIERQNNYQQAGERYRAFEPWERDELISNLVGELSKCPQDIQERMLWHFSRSDAEYGRRVAEGLGQPVPTSLPTSLQGIVPESDLRPPSTGQPAGDSITSPKASGNKPEGKA